MWEAVWHASAQVVFWLALVASVFTIFFGLPGTFFITGLALLHGLLTHFDPLRLSDVLILLGLAVTGEVLEFSLGAFTAKKYGGSNWAVVGAIVGGFLGAVWGTGLLPVVGTVIGAFAGAFAGAFLLEFLHRKEVEQALRVGWGAFLGALGGKFMKILLAVAMLVLILARFV